ncbi:hypothetical protein LCGC14_2121240, partial [marine sediment metagenome]
MKEPEKKPTKKQFGFSIWYILIGAFALLSIHAYLFGPVATENISYSEFKMLIKEGKVETCHITSSLIRGT